MIQSAGRQQLRRIAKNRVALSTVVTTLIILVISVLLASVVTYFAINVTSTRVQEENLALTKQHVWYDSVNQKAEASIMVINAGGRDIVIDRLTVRGQECAWSKVLYFITSDSITSDLCYNATLMDGGSIYVGGSNRVFKQAANDLTLQSGKTLIIYMSNPDSISVSDIGLTVSVNVFTSQAMYYKETNVQGSGGTSTVSNASPTTAPTETPAPGTVQILYAAAYSPTVSSGAYQQVAMVVKNTGSSTESITRLDFLIEYGRPDYLSNMFAAAGVSNPTSTLPYFTMGATVQDVTPTSTVDFSLAPGETGIIYFQMTPIKETLWDEGTTFTVQLVLDNEEVAAQQATVHIYDIL